VSLNLVIGVVGYRSIIDSNESKKNRRTPAVHIQQLLQDKQTDKGKSG